MILDDSESSEVGLHAQGNLQERGGKLWGKKDTWKRFFVSVFLVVMGNAKKRFQVSFFPEAFSHALVNYLVRVGQSLSFQNHPGSLKKMQN